MDDRTSEQVAADNALDDAIAAACRAYGASEFAVGWVVVCGLAGQDPSSDATMVLHPGGTQPAWQSVGLLRVGMEDLLNNRRVTTETDD